jgi:uncharacterized protein YbaR (Trm112 family)
MESQTEKADDFRQPPLSLILRMTVMSESTSTNAIDPDLLSILRCPVTRSALRQEGDFLIAEVGGLAYPVRDGIPVMLAEEARLPQGIGSLDEFKQRYREQIPQ